MPVREVVLRLEPPNGRQPSPTRTAQGVWRYLACSHAVRNPIYKGSLVEQAYGTPRFIHECVHMSRVWCHACRLQTPYLLRF